VRIADLDARIPRLKFKVADGTPVPDTMTLDGETFGEDRIGVWIYVNPGLHTVAASAPQYRQFTISITIAEGGRQRIEIVLEPVTSAKAVTSRDGRWYLGWGLLGVGVAIAAGGGIPLWILGAQDRRQYGEFQSKFATSGKTEDALKANQFADEATAKFMAAGIVTAIGSAGMISGASVLLGKRRSTPSEPKLSVTYVPGGVGASYSGTF
jgi:hypothetical protein